MDGFGASGPAVVAELQHVLDTACGALQAQEDGRMQEALQCYFLARSRVRYVAEALLGPLAGVHPGDTEVALAAATCSLLDETYTLAVECLIRDNDGSGGGGGTGTAGGSAYTGCGEDGLFEEESEEAEEAEGPMQPRRQSSAGHAHNRCQQYRLDAGLLEVHGSGGGSDGIGGIGGGDGSGGSGGKRPQQQRLSALAQRCLREVEGNLDDVVGLTTIKQELREAVLLPMSLPHLFTGIRRPQVNILFHGVPGTGKTMLVEKVAAEAGTPLLAVSPAAILSKWAGESEQTLRAVFEAAAALSPAIVFIDEVDSLAPTRSGGDDLASRRVLTELLIQMTAAAARPGPPVFVMACTNRPQDCDPALMRRFDRKIEVPAPDADARAAFFTATAQRPEVAACLSGAEVAALASATEGCTGSDLAVLCREAAMAPLRELVAGGALRRDGSCGGRGNGSGATCMAAAEVALRQVTYADFAAAADKLRIQGDGC